MASAGETGDVRGRDGDVQAGGGGETGCVAGLVGRKAPDEDSSGEDGGAGVPESASSTVASCSSSSFPLGLYCVSPGNCSSSGLIPALSAPVVAAPRTHSLWWQHLVLVLDMHGSGRGSGRGSGILCIRFCIFCIRFYRFCLLGDSSIGSCSGHQSGSVSMYISDNKTRFLVYDNSGQQHHIDKIM
jgi:hypothetical protein